MSELAAAVTKERPTPFPRIFVVANSIELLERLAYYGMAVNLSLYLSKTVGFTDTQQGVVMGVFAAARAFLPLAAGAFADTFSFRRSLMLSFTLYAIAYGALWAWPSQTLTPMWLIGIAGAGAFLKPVITGTVKRYSPPGRQTEGFAIFYQTVNAGSVVGKVIAKNVREILSLRSTIITSVVVSVAALVMTIALFFEPKGEQEGAAQQAAGAPRPGPLETIVSTLVAYAQALRKPQLVGFLVLVSGYYLLIEQFYQTFPIYMSRVLPTAPREYLTLINPLAIAILQVFVARATKKLDPLAAMATGIGIGAVSMLTMGMFPTVAGAACSFFIFALAEMVFSPRYYDYVSSFAPKGQEGMYMGLALAPFGVGGLVGGVLSGQLLERFLPENGAHQPLMVWGIYAAIGIGCAALLATFRAVVTRSSASA